MRNEIRTNGRRIGDNSPSNTDFRSESENTRALAFVEAQARAGVGQDKLEVEAAAKLQRTPAGDACDVAERSATHCCIGVAKQRVIGYVEALDANLELALAIQVESPEHAYVSIRLSRSAELIAVGVREDRRDDRRLCLGRCVRWLGLVGEGCRVEPGLAARYRRVAGRAVVAANLLVRRNEFGVQRVAGGVETCAARGASS